MSSNEVTKLRKAGKLDEALKMITQLLEADPNDIWNKRAASWVYYDYLKKYCSPDTFKEFKENLIKIKDLQLSKDEDMIFDNCAGKIGTLLFALNKSENIAYGKINELFEIVKYFHITKPSDTFSFLFKAFHKGQKDWGNYLEFADWWNFENFRPEDFLEEEYNGKKIISIAEKAYNAYSKKLLLGKPMDQYGNQHLIDKSRIQSFIPRMDSVIDKYPHYQYLPYFKAKLLLALGNDENVLSAFLPFAQKKKNDFWVWDLMAEIFADDKDTQFACYCKALSLRTKDDFLLKLRTTFAGALIERKLFDEAKTEISKVIETRQKNDWKIAGEILAWTKSDWYEAAKVRQNNLSLYSQHTGIAEAILFQGIPEEVITIEFVNQDKQMLNFIKNKQKHGFLKYKGYLKNPQVGDLVSVRFDGEGKDGYFKLLQARAADPIAESEAIKSFMGPLKLIAQKNFGFVEDVFIDPRFIEMNQLENGQHLQGKAILSFNKKKNQWGWKVLVAVPFIQ